MKILFTFDPFEKNNWKRNQIKNLVANFTGADDSLKALYVASRAEVNLATAYDIPEKDRYSAYPKKLMEKGLKDFDLPDAQAVVLYESTLSQSAAVEKVSAFAKKDKTDLIFISTNAKSLLPRMVFGSFAETLVNASSTDLLVYHQKTKVGSKSGKNILFAHDFTKKGEAGLLRVSEYAKKWKAALTVVHIAVPESDLAKLQAKAKKMEKQLISSGIEAEVILESSWDSTADVIMEFAHDHKATLIALASQVESESLLGSSVRKILRESKIPTLVLKV